MPTVTLIRQCPISNLSKLLSYTMMYSNFMFLNSHTLTSIRKVRNYSQQWVTKTFAFQGHRITVVRQLALGTFHAAVSSTTSEGLFCIHKKHVSPPSPQHPLLVN